MCAKTLACGRSNTIETLSDVFTLQGEIAQKIADKLGVGVSPAEKTAFQDVPTSDLISYDAYLRAKDLLYDIALSTRQKEDLFQAVQLLDQAVARDPSFFDAYCQLAGAHDRIFFLAFDHTDARLKLAESVIQSIQRLQPEPGRNSFGSRSALLLCVPGLRPSPAGTGACSPDVAERVADPTFGRLY